MTPAERQAIESLLTGFGWCADHGDAQGLCALFLADGELHVNGLQLQGQQALSQDFGVRLRKPGRTMRHLWSNLRLVEQGKDSITCTALQQTFERDGDGPVTLRVNDIADRFARDAAGQWKFAKRVVQRQFAVQLPVPEAAHARA